MIKKAKALTIISIMLIHSSGLSQDSITINKNICEYFRAHLNGMWEVFYPSPEEIIDKSIFIIKDSLSVEIGIKKDTISGEWSVYGTDTSFIYVLTRDECRARCKVCYVCEWESSPPTISDSEIVFLDGMPCFFLFLRRYDDENSGVIHPIHFAALDKDFKEDEFWSGMHITIFRRITDTTKIMELINKTQK